VRDTEKRGHEKRNIGREERERERERKREKEGFIANDDVIS
jgi:hypothetical protein